MDVLAALGDAPTAAIAVVAILLGVFLAARGQRGERGAADDGAMRLNALFSTTGPSSGTEGPEAMAPGEVGHGTIRLGGESGPAAEPDAVPEPDPAPAVEAAPEVDAAPAVEAAPEVDAAAAVEAATEMQAPPAESDPAPPDPAAPDPAAASVPPPPALPEPPTPPSPPPTPPHAPGAITFRHGTIRLRKPKD